jgi:hypothetical protein
MSDQGPKSALEIAMERLRAKDAREGVEQRSVTDQQKTAIAEVRNFYDAKLAQDEVMHQSALARVYEPEARAVLQQEYSRDRQRLIAERDAKIERLRRGEAGG